MNVSATLACLVREETRDQDLRVVYLILFKFYPSPLRGFLPLLTWGVEEKEGVAELWQGSDVSAR